MSDREFKGVWIPKEIWLCKDLTALDRVIYAEIDSLDNENHCTASNKYFAEFCGVGEATVTRSIQKLIDKGYIEVASFDGRHRVIKMIKQTNQNDEAESSKCVANNIDNKQTNNITILSKDNIDTDFQFGTKKSKTKKPSLYDKCVSMIDDFTTDVILGKKLIDALKLFLENSRESNTAFYSNHFKGKLNTLSKLSDDTITQRKIVQQTLDNGWNNFYELKTNNRKTKNVMTDIEHLSHGLSERAEKGDVSSGEKF